ncbi:MAG: hypothetical protein J5780_00355, partial [Treponema sp.]|nr:hypothetical protein [Treponema sp.]
VKIEKTETGISTLWGNQLTAVNSSVKHIVFTAFISAAYSSAEQKDPLETAFNVLLQIFADPLYTSKKELLLPALKDGVDAYNGGTGWAEYKEAHFSTADGTITVIE